jgi:signal peptidase
VPVLTFRPERQTLTQRDRSVVAYIPFVGYVTIMLSEHPWLKTVMLGLMGLMVVMQRE